MNDYLKLPIFSWRKNLESVYTECNQHLANVAGFSKIDELIGLQDGQMRCRASEWAENFRQQDSLVATSKQFLKTLEMNYYFRSQKSSDEMTVLFAIKKPIFNQEKEIIGTEGKGVDITSLIYEINNLLPEVTNRKPLPGQASYMLNSVNSDIKLTERQTDCIFYLLRGKTVKQIAANLRLSPRTIETYIDNLKDKFNCYSKSELIEKAIELGFAMMIPERLFVSHLNFLGG